MDFDKQCKIVNEIVNDAFWLNYILELKRNITDYNQKEILTYFLLIFSPIFSCEILKADYAQLAKNSNLTQKEIEKFRNSILKKCFNSTSKTARDTINEMGINLDNYTFDMVLSMNKSKIIDINFRNWYYDKECYYDFLENIISIPNNWLEQNAHGLYENVLEQLKNYMNFQLCQISNFTIVKKSYSSNRFFSKALLNFDDKVYILQRYGLVQIIKFVDALFSENISTCYNDIQIESNTFIMKCKAILIEMFYNDYKKNGNIAVSNDIYRLNNTNIPSDFYKFNRKIRNNLHYSDYHYLTDNELKVVQNYQDIYISNIESVFNSKIHLKFGLGYKILLELAKIQYWCNKQQQ